MDILILETSEQVANVAAQRFQDQLGKKPDSVLGLATGRSPLALYHLLAEKCEAKELSFQHATSFNLDEYLGLKAGHPQSYRAYMQREFFDQVDFPANKTHLPECGADEDPAHAAERYERLICDSGGVDLQLLGLGRNGHIGFNEPSSSLGSRTRVKTLTRETVVANLTAGEQSKALPELAITMGIATIMDAREILLLACGTDKAQAVQHLVEGCVCARWPASILQMHEHVTLLIDEAASQQLELREYYLHVQQQKRLLTDRVRREPVLIGAGN